MDYFGAYLISGLLINFLLSFLVAYVASEKGRSGPGFFFLSFFFSFLVGILVALAVPSVGNASAQGGNPSSAKFIQDEPRLCPYCAEEIKWEASVCKHCSRDIEPQYRPAPAAVRNWCPRCRHEVFGRPQQKCPDCNMFTHVWEDN